MSEYDKKKINSENAPVIILVDPQLAENIGMVARAMYNFGLTQLRLINPRDGWPSEKARSSSANADYVIDGVRVFPNLQEAIADLNFTYATTARNRNNFKSVVCPKEAAVILRNRVYADQKVGIVFGRERWGLTNEEISLSDAIISFPVNPNFPSLNISQAVLLMAWEWMENCEFYLEKDVKDFGSPATKGELFSFLSYLENSLEERGYFRPVERKKKMLDDLRSVFILSEFTRNEVFLLRGIVSALDRFSRKNPRGNRFLSKDQNNHNRKI
ncbi:RNA methyltransferase [Candidatus Liberibacter americanus]|uniref:tRNA (cytidine/uridine-2'-O-)-methyltransferase TrmJ n=1 Tax=Candidatus Liberibacter americanus str. Sao Paulo TaxID=1261131 RepID=U6B8T6_9HYPH|nr:RNA methyltransferase [Candidatus Liberibacter americanus]AHA28167.1 rRNA methylase [Candidatus Liberibacter americanus str. Sao Paulo]EMS35921.1 tRNA/rRNA methyltransferase [Candidatus Liberibacter americanus PW_SP]